jgi:hypothetical protein
VVVPNIRTAIVVRPAEALWGRCRIKRPYLRLDRRDLVWINVTTNPTAEWIAHQITEAFPWNGVPRYLIRDRDQIYGAIVTGRLRALGIRDKPVAPASPWHNGFVERVIGSIRRECVDHFIVLGERICAEFCGSMPITITSGFRFLVRTGKGAARYPPR